VQGYLLALLLLVVYVPVDFLMQDLCFAAVQASE
jgi:hypothetical protein